MALIIPSSFVRMAVKRFKPPSQMVKRAGSTLSPQIQPSSRPPSKLQNQPSSSVKMQTNPAQESAPLKKPANPAVFPHENAEKSSSNKDKRPKFGETPPLKPLPIERQRDALYPNPNPWVGEFYITKPKKSQ